MSDPGVGSASEQPGRGAAKQTALSTVIEGSRRLLIAPLVAVVLLASCGDDDASATRGGEPSDQLQPYADALSESLAVEEIADELTLTDRDADCVADESARVIGIERLEHVGDPDDVTLATENDLSIFELNRAELDEISNAFFDCVADAEQLLRDTFLQAAQLEGEQADCVADLVDLDLLVRILSTGIGGQDPETAVADIQADFLACL